MPIDQFVYHWYEEPDHSIVSVNKSKLKAIFPNSEDNFFFLRYKSKKVRVGSLKRFCDFVGMSHSDLERKSIVKINNVKFPFKLNVSEFAILIAAATNEGHLHNKKYLFEYYNKDRKLHELVNKCMINIFGIKMSGPKPKGYALESYSYGVVARALHNVGVALGDKAIVNANLPTIIKRGGEKAQKLYIRQTLIEEGSIELPIKKGKYLGLNMQYGRSVDITDKVSDIFRNEIKVGQQVLFNNLPVNIKNIVKSNPPLLLKEEKEIFNSFDIFPNLRPCYIYKIKRKGRVRAHWRLHTGETRSVELLFENFIFVDKIMKDAPIKLLESLDKFKFWRKYRGRPLSLKEIDMISQIIEKWRKIKRECVEF